MSGAYQDEAMDDCRVWMKLREFVIYIATVGRSSSQLVNFVIPEQDGIQYHTLYG
jgi:hypothetical protein